MNIEELNERIEQLTNLVITSEETIRQLNEALKSVEQERDRLADERRELEPKFERVDKYEKYHFLVFDPEAMVGTNIDHGEKCKSDTEYFESNNYFKTESRALEVCDKIKLLLKLERFYDIYCPDYKPDWNSSENKYLILYSHTSNKYSVGNAVYSDPSLSRFPTREIAQKVCDILNKEREGKK